MKINSLTLSCILLIALFLGGCKSSLLSGKQKVAFPDGFYPVLHSYSTYKEAKGAEKTLIPFNENFVDQKQDDEPFYLEIDAEDFVPLRLAAAPDTVERENELTQLNIQLTEEAGEQFADFTEKHVDERVALVVGGEAVTMHVIRTRIEGGRMQITRCTDNACEFIFVELLDNYNHK